ncbi:TetR/AcrR family transcriptional regulator [Psychrosphaera sp. F3M07]|uniref:TetR/AcrR family transcriptional regulator n=1 Tax=Psychrosphaera sp. F3M07 TaxID=2841560 RepID=UPI001C0A41B1|nr:TetR/AcrR family transcriptional regulator [Psychrosphaera sp. F3M07]MBU2919035.1 TetR/AcrR family transcriptional regulator [Psychrosphaera sp. F3M07]
MAEQKKTRSVIKREAIITGALAAFQQYGVADSSMDKIAELAQVSKRTVYNHFESKEVLVAEIITSEWEKRTVVYDALYDANKDIKSQLTALVANEVELMCDSAMMELVRVAMAHFLFAPDTLQHQMAKMFEQETALQRWLKLAMADGKLKTLDVNFAHDQIKGLLKSRAFWPQLLRQQEPLTANEKTELVDMTVGMFLSYYQA